MRIFTAYPARIPFTHLSALTKVIIAVSIAADLHQLRRLAVRSVAAAVRSSSTCAFCALLIKAMQIKNKA